MSLINPWDSKKGVKEDVKELKNLVMQHDGILRMLLTKFDADRRFYAEIEKMANPPSEATPAEKPSESPDVDKKSSDNPSSSEQKA